MVTSRFGILLSAAAMAAGALVPGSAAATSAEFIDFHRWSSYPDFRAGTSKGVLPVPGFRTGLVLTRPVGTVDYTDPHTKLTKKWEYGTWTSPVHRLNGGATQLVASWNASTPAGTWLQVEMLGHYADGTATPWFVMGRWASGDADIKRTTVPDQSDPHSYMDADTWTMNSASKAAGVRLRDYQLRLTLYRAPGSHANPRAWMLSAMASDVPDRFTVPATAPGAARGVDLAVPPRSQNVHSGHYPEYDGGGGNWCSPTSTTMVLEHFGRHPSPADLAWIPADHPDREVDHAARHVYDYDYQGAGNWPFNTAYAATYPLMDGVITRLHSLSDVERLVKAGIPVILSISFRADELDGAGYTTNGHIFVVAGFTPTGDVIVNDPASKDNASVRHVYKRAQIETIWLRTKRIRPDGKVGSGSGGIAYLIKPATKPWPQSPTSTW